MSPWSRGWRSDRRLAARLNHQPNFVDGAWANECGAEPWRRKQHQRTDPKTAGPRLRLGPARCRSQPGCERRQPAFSQTSPRELARKRSSEAASRASKLERCRDPSAWKVSGGLLQPVTDRFKREVPAAVVARGNIARIEIKARHGGT